MNKLLLILLSIFCISCSSLDKFGHKKYFKQKAFDITSQHHDFIVDYYVTTDNENHCFNSNPMNKEIMTVNAQHLNYAVAHFYTRVTKVDVKITRYNDERAKINFIVTDDAHFKLETAYCSFKKFGGLLSNHDVEYVSFRLANN